MMDAGIVHICRLEDTAAPGDMPVERLAETGKAYFEERTVGMNRQYAAKGVNEQVDMLVRIWWDPSVRIGMYAVLTDSAYDGQYRIDNVQHALDGKNLRVTDLTLSRLEDYYDTDFEQQTETGA